ncbi:MAG: hypothetical protein IJY25_00465 [Bacilli bacterium]|nr:hypothetical protein [Bacilli bacterium]
MFKINDYVVYKRNVCRIKEIKDNIYYVLVPIDDESLIITISKDNPNIRNIINKEECEKLINSIPSIEVIKENDKLIENEYKNLLNSGKLEDLVKIIKTTYLRNLDRISNHKKIGEKDDNYFKKSENLLYNELSICLNLSYEETKDYVIKKVTSLEK